jgi:Uma2 family endonuclease
MSMVAETTLVSVEEYLRTEYDPSCDYIDGVLRQKAMPTRKHAKIQLRLCNLIEGLRIGFDAAPEQTLRIREEKYLVPDVAVQEINELQDGEYPSEPIHLCVEVVSPEDRFSSTVSKCDEYHAWGVPYCWIIDPQKRRAWQYDAGGRPNEVPADGSISAGPIILNHADIFAEPY